VWELLVYLSCDPLTGRKRQPSQTVRGGRRDAERALAKLIGDVYDGWTAGGVPAATVDELLERWLDLSGDDLSPSMLREHRRIIRTRLSPGAWPDYPSASQESGSMTCATFTRRSFSQQAYRLEPSADVLGMPRRRPRSTCTHTLLRRAIATRH